MFNCLQEGICVIQEKGSGMVDELLKMKSETQMFFVNEMGGRILQKIFKTNQYKNLDHKIDGEMIREMKLF